MRIYNTNNVPRGVPAAQSMQDLTLAIGEKPFIKKEIIQSNDFGKGLTIERITKLWGDLLFKKAPTTTTIDSMMIDWLVESNNRIPRIPIMENNTDIGQGGSEVRIVLDRYYYSRGAIFELDNRQQLRVMRRAEKLTENRWAYYCQIVTSRSSEYLDTTFTSRGRFTTYITRGSIVPEASEYGGAYLEPFNIERHRNYISRYRMDLAQTGDFAARGMNYIESQGIWYKQNSAETQMVKMLLEDKNQHMLFGKGNFTDGSDPSNPSDIGRCLITEEDGRKIPIGEGVFPQIERFANFYPYNGSLSERKLSDIIDLVVSRKEEKTGNKILCICNYRLYTHLQSALNAILATRLVNQDFYVERTDGKRLILGAEYAGYRVNGNELILMEDIAISNRYPSVGYGVIINMLAETKDGGKKMNIEQVSLKGFDLFTNKKLGVGGEKGNDSGNVASSVHGKEMYAMSYGCAIVNDPYGSVIIQETTY